jgi:uncharacterized protein (DUF1810 family)
MSDPFNLNRFVEVQDPVLDQVRRELAAGRKQGHWMWYIFPQIAGLGHSATARHYAIASVAEARAYLEHATLGPRLIACTRLVNQISDRSAREIFGTPDDLKFHSSMTLFSIAHPDAEAFQTALARYFGGEADRATIDRVG